MFKKEEFRTGDYIVLRNGERLIYTKGRFYDIADEGKEIKNPICCLSDFNDRLKFIGSKEEYDILLVQRPTITIIPRLFEDDVIEEHIKKIWDRREEKEPAKEMTIEEISEALGYDVKVVKKRG